MSRGGHLRLGAAGVVVFLAASLAAFFYFVELSGTSLLPGSSYQIRALVPSAVALANHADVREAGVKIGDVTGITTESDHAILGLSLDPRYRPVYRNATVLIRSKDLLGENYVDLQPGSRSAGAVPAGGTLPLTDAPESTQLDQILSTLDAPRRADAQRILDALGAGVGGHGRDLNSLLANTSRVVNAFRPVYSTLDPDRVQLAALIQNTDRVAQALGDRSAEIPSLARAIRQVATATAARDMQLRATLAALPGFLAQARGTIGQLGHFSTSATPVLHTLRVATEQLTPAVIGLRPAAENTLGAIQALHVFSRKAIPLVSTLRAFAIRATPVLGPFEDALRQANPLVAYLSPYSKELSAVFSGVRSVTEYADSLGHFGRVAGVVTRSALIGVLPPAADQAVGALFNAGILKNLVGTRGSNPYPKPGEVDGTTSFAGSYQLLQADPPYQLTPGSRKPAGRDGGPR